MSFKNAHTLISKRLLSSETCLLDTLQMVKGLTAKGVPAPHAEAITDAVNKSFNFDDYVLKSEMENAKIIQESSLGLFKINLETMQEVQAIQLKTEMVKLRGDMERQLIKEVGGLKALIEEDKTKILRDVADLNHKLDLVLLKEARRVEATKFKIANYGMLFGLAAAGILILMI